MAVPFDLCVGLGQHCESTYQIRRITGQETAQFFDWLEIDLVFVRQALETNFRGLLKPGRMALTTDGQGAIDLDAGIEFYHEFHAHPDAELTLADIEEQLPAVRKKLEFLADRWRDLVASPARVLYVRQDANGVETAADLERLQTTLRERYPGHDFAILWLRRTVPEDLDKLPKAVACREIPLLEGRWQGDDRAWDELFATLPVDELWP